LQVLPEMWQLFSACSGKCRKLIRLENATTRCVPERLID
jgi:hypothetical protein